MGFNFGFFLCSALILGSILVTPYKVAGAPRLISGDTEYQQQDRAPQTDSELNVEAIKQQLRLVPQQSQSRVVQSFVRKQAINNEADIEPLYQFPLRLQPISTRLQRSTASQSSLLPLSLQMDNQQKLSLEDELALRRQLPELIAQARSDKNVERALLKMLISASLRSSPSSGTTAAQYQGRPDAWQDVASENGSVDGALFRIPSRLAQMINDYVAIDPTVNDASQMEQYPAAIVDKREYTKPCSFNAISCAKPFRERKT